MLYEIDETRGPLKICFRVIFLCSFLSSNDIEFSMNCCANS